MPLPESDYVSIGVSGWGLFDWIQAAPADVASMVCAATHRLAEVGWLSETLDAQVRRGDGPVVAEGLLSLQIYGLLSCADSLGRIYLQDAGRRFREFFRSLPLDEK